MSSENNISENNKEIKLSPEEETETNKDVCIFCYKRVKTKPIMVSLRMYDIL